jgi:hypothetical protein
MAHVTDLSGLDVDEVAVVKRAATGRRFDLLKADADGDVELSKEVVDALAAPLADEAAFVEKLQKDGLDEHAREAAVVVARLAKGFGFDADAVLKREQQHTPQELAAIKAGAVPELQGAGEDNDDDVAEDEEFLPQADLTKADSPAAYVLAQVQKALEEK